MYSNYQNPYFGGYSSLYGGNNNQPSQAKQDIVQVNGENGARAYQIGANSSALLLDTQAPIVWLVQTDGAGYKTVTAYDIAPHKQAEQIDISKLDERLKKVEELLNESNSKPIDETV